MEKEELIHYHTLFRQVRKYLGDNFGHLCSEPPFDDFFTKYDALKISPVHVHKSKTEHHEALRILGGEIVKLMAYLQDKGGASPAAHLQRQPEKPSIYSPKEFIGDAYRLPANSAKAAE